MSLLSDLLRSYWLPGLNSVTGRQTGSIGNWVLARKFQVYTPLVPSGGRLSFSAIQPLLEAFASDVARFSTAAFESADGISQNSALPKSLAWLLIRCYYSAFFAAHATLRLLGRGATQFEGGHLLSIHTVADIYSMRNGVALSSGVYGSVVDVANAEILITRCAGASGGSHVAMWAEYTALLSHLINGLLPTGHTSPPAQQVAAQLSALQSAITAGGHVLNGSWLSQVRNRANYQLAFGVWYPYAERKKYYERLFDICARWKEDPMTLPVWPHKDRDLQRFVESCTLIVAICRALSEDMATRCPVGKSFHRFSGVSLMTHIGSPAGV